MRSYALNSGNRLGEIAKGHSLHLYYIINGKAKEKAQRKRRLKIRTVHFQKRRETETA